MDVLKKKGLSSGGAAELRISRQGFQEGRIQEKAETLLLHSLQSGRV